MRFGLYQKFFMWLILNIALLCLLFLLIVGGVLLFNTNHLYPPQLFNGDVSSIFRVTSAELQYKEPKEWQHVLHAAALECGLQLHLQMLDEPAPANDVPELLVQAAARLPRPPYSLCASPDELTGLGGSEITPEIELEAGIIPQQYAIFLWDRTTQPSRYWYGRTILISDVEGNVRYALLAASSPSLTGEGHFFITRWVLLLILCSLAVSFLWWCPFMHALIRPIVSLTRITQQIAAGKCSELSEKSAHILRQAGADRADELGSLIQATAVMAEKVHQQVYGQRRFIRHIAHELNSPLARLKLGLAVLENRTDGENQQRVQELAEEAEQISILVEDVLGFLRSEAIPEQPVREPVPMRALLQSVARQEGMEHNVRVEAGKEHYACADPLCLRRALANVVRNAVRYAGKDGPVLLSLTVTGNDLHVRVQDSGSGVSSADLAHITEPFYRGERAKEYPGGSGLGLSIVKHCVEACGGELLYENMQPKGFCVTITLRLFVKKTTNSA